jgi:ATP-dependent RNA helicase DeaD
MTETPQDDSITFEDLGLRPELLTALSHLGYEEPTPIQAEAIPPLLAGRDLLGQAATGTGKTAAFALPALARWTEAREAGEAAQPSVLVLTPTRELAMQVAEAMHKYGRELGVKVLPIYGGQPIGRQLKALGQGVDVVVATPGRALDHMGRGTLPLEGLRTVVLDEADEMLDMGFADEIDAILDETPKGRQTVLFSATMPDRIGHIAERHLKDPVRLEIGREPTAPGEGPLVRQTGYLVARAHKPAALGRVLDMEAPEASIVFCRTRNQVDELAETLNGRGYRSEALHGGMNQVERDRVMGRLRSGAADLLVATDVAARGLDVDRLTHVINYEVPSAPESYVHRIGRVGRAGREGVAITLAEPREHRLLKNIERLTGQKIEIEPVPTVADLRTRRLEVTRAALRETILAGESERFRAVVESLTDEFDLMEVALAAVGMAHEGDGIEPEEGEIPALAPIAESPRAKPSQSKPSHKSRQRAERARSKGRGAESGMTWLFVGAGRSQGMRPKDLVGAIANESSLKGRDIGAIEISERFSLVEVPTGAADEVIASLRNSSIRGQRVKVRRERY